MSLDTRAGQKIGWAPEATAETDPISAADSKYWNFGVMTTKLENDFPGETHNWVNRYTANQRNPSDSELVETYVSGALAFYPVNAIPWYWLLGSSVTTTGVHAINNLNSSALPTITIRSERAGGTVAEYESAVGCKVHSISVMVELISGFPFMSQTLGYHSIKTQTASYNGAHDGRVYPTDDGLMTGTPTVTKYKYDNNASFHWDSNSDGAGDTDYTSYLEQFECSVVNQMDLGYVENSAELEYIDEGNYTISYNFTLKRGANNNIYTDFKNQGSDHDMYLHIHAGATNYQTLSLVNCALITCRAPKTMGNRTPTWVVQGIAEDFAVSAVDGVLAEEYYGE